MRNRRGRARSESSSTADEPGSVGNSLHGTDFIKPLVHFERSELPFAQKVLAHHSKICGLRFREPGKHVSSKHAQAVIDVLHRGRKALLVVANDSHSVELDVARIELPVV